MKNVIKMSLAAAVMMTVGTVSAQAEDGINILSNVKVKGEIRPRYEFVDASDEATTDKPDANALTNRLVLGVGADLFGTDWLSGYAEITDVHSLNNNYDGFDGKGHGNEVVADPEQTRVTQAYADLKYGKTKLRAGRQMINLDNQRFVGAVGWRQMPQTYDAFMLSDNTVENLNLAAVYVSTVNTVFADGGSKVDSAETETVLLNASYKVMDELTVTAYGYLIASVSDTYGLALTGKAKAGDIGLDYRAEYAMQRDASLENNNDGEPDNDSEYYNLELTANMNGIIAGVGYEVLGADDDNTAAGAGTTNKAFSTPLATGHAFNGWADMFLATPENGLEDLNFTLGYKSKELGLLKAVYHDFSAEDGGDDYGTEIDVIYTRAIPGVTGLTGMLKYADYQEDGYKVDTQKFWAMLTYKFSN